MRALRIIFLVTFLDFLAFSLVIPYLPILFLDSDFLSGIDHKMRYVILGILYATYPVSQAITAPIWGKYSDRFGRKNVLILAYMGNGLGYLCCTLSLLYSSLVPFFIGNLIAGLTGANLATVNALISDQCKEEKRKKYFGISYLLLGLAFTLGPFLCAEWLHGTALFLGCSVISFFNVWMISTFFPKSATKENTLPFEIHFRSLFAYRREIKLFLFAIFLLTFGWFVFVKTFQIFLIENVKLHGTEVLRIVSYYGLCLFISQILFVFFLHKCVRSRKFVTFFSLLLSTSILALFFAHGASSILPFVTLVSFSYSMISPTITSFFSQLSYEDNGQMMGFHQSVQAIAKIIAPLTVSGTLLIDPSAALIVSALSIFGCGAVCFTTIFEHKKIPISYPAD